MEDDRPLSEYAGLATAFWLLFAAFLATNRGRLPDRYRTSDIALIALSSYKLSRVITKDQVTAFVRAPVTEDPGGRQPKPEGFARVLGELVTCPYCLGLWISSALTAAHVVAPRETRFFTAIFGSYGVTDFLHASFVRVRKSS